MRQQLEQRQRDLDEKQRNFSEFEKQTRGDLEAEKARLAQEREELIAKAKAEGLT